MCVPALAHAQSDDAILRARGLGEEGARAYERGEWEVARSLFHRARDLYPAPTLGVREARALVQLGRLVEAARVYERVETTPIDDTDQNVDVETFRQARDAAHRELAELRARIPRVKLDVAGIFGRVTIALDGRDVPLTLVGVEHEIDPGLHTISAAYDGQPSSPTTVTLSEGEKRTIVLQPPVGFVHVERAAPPIGRTQRIAGYVTFGVSAIGLGLGVGLGVAATSKHDELDGLCANGTCPPSASSTLDEFHTLRTASTIAYVASGVLAAAGLAVVLLAPSAKAPRTAMLSPFGLRGEF